MQFHTQKKQHWAQALEAEVGRHANKCTGSQCCESGMFIPDPIIFSSWIWIPDPKGGQNKHTFMVIKEGGKMKLPFMQD
jgi:hypothetical protein